MRPYTQIVSLGLRCDTTLNVRRFFGHAEGFPFDWWITPPDGLKMVLERGEVGFLYDPDHLFREEDGSTVTHAPSGISLHHEFPRVESLSGPVVDDFLEHVEPAKSRSLYLMDKLLRLNRADQRILFIRAGQCDPDLGEILSALLPQAAVEFAVIDPPPLMPGDPWYGRPEKWDATFRRLDAILDNPLAKPFEGIDSTPIGQMIATAAH